MLRECSSTPCFTCQVSHFTCQVSGVTCQLSRVIFYIYFYFEKEVELVFEGLLSRGPALSSFVANCFTIETCNTGVVEGRYFLI